MFLSVGLWDLLRFEHEDPEMEERLGHLQADLEFFVTSETIDTKYLFPPVPSPRCGLGNPKRETGPINPRARVVRDKGRFRRNKPCHEKRPRRMAVQSVEHG